MKSTIITAVTGIAITGYANAVTTAAQLTEACSALFASSAHCSAWNTQTTNVKNNTCNCITCATGWCTITGDTVLQTGTYNSVTFTLQAKCATTNCGSSGGGSTDLVKCGSNNKCIGTSLSTSDGKTWCATAPTPNACGVTDYTIWMSEYCENGYGVSKTAECRLYKCDTNEWLTPPGTECICNMNTYGTPSNTTVENSHGTCQKCPTLGNNNVGGKTQGYGYSSVTSCYIQKNTDITDDTGTYQFINDCFHS